MSVEIPSGYDDTKPEDENQDRGRTYSGYEDAVLENRARARYYFCLNYIKEDDICLDAACGSGYGTELISAKAQRVIGIEISDHALKYAREHHNRDNIEYRSADIAKHIDYPDDYFDIIVSVETIEHILEQNSMLAEFSRLLKPGGRIIITTVDHRIYNEIGGIKNKFHIGELTKDELLALVGKYFELDELFGQIKYESLPFHKRIYRKIWRALSVFVRTIDIFSMRLKLMKAFGIFETAKNVDQSFGTMVETSVERTEFEEDNKYYQLLLVASKGK